VGVDSPDLIPFYTACLPPKTAFHNRCIRYAKRRLGWKQTSPQVVTKVTAAVASKHRDFPISVNIVLGNQCNLSCDHCFYHSRVRASYFDKPEEMSWPTVRRIIDELPLHRTFAKFGSYEEPLLYYPKFSELASAFIHSGVGVHLTTNGTLIRPDRIGLLQNLRTLYVSLDAASAGTYKEIRGGDYERVLKNTLDLASSFKGIQMGTSFIRQPRASHEEQAFIDFWLPKVDMVILYALLAYNESGYSIDQPFLAPPPYRVVCSSPWLETYVMPNGDVTLCCQTLVMTGRTNIPVMGNINNQSLERIWNGPSYERYRAALIDQDWDHANICRDCPIWSASYYTVEHKDGLKITRNPTTKVIEEATEA